MAVEEVQVVVEGYILEEVEADQVGAEQVVVADQVAEERARAPEEEDT